MSSPGLLRGHVAWPQDHGAWVFLLTPLIVGLYAGGRWTVPSLYLVVAALAGFLIRQPIAVAVKVASGRRGGRDLPAAIFWIAFYGGVGLLHVLGLVLRGYADLLYLAIPAAPVFAWYLVLLSRRAERRQTGLEILAAGALALSAPAGRWIGTGEADLTGWLLWALTWTQATASLLHVRARLDARSGEPAGLHPMAPTGLAGLNLLAVAGLGLAAVLPPWLWLAYAVQALECLAARRPPPAGIQPRTIGVRQLLVSTLFTAAFLLAWR